MLFSTLLCFRYLLDSFWCHLVATDPMGKSSNIFHRRRTSDPNGSCFQSMPRAFVHKKKCRVEGEMLPRWAFFCIFVLGGVWGCYKGVMYKGETTNYTLKPLGWGVFYWYHIYLWCFNLLECLGSSCFSLLDWGRFAKVRRATRRIGTRDSRSQRCFGKAKHWSCSGWTQSLATALECCFSFCL